jgi:hypothetical protein
LTTDKAARFNRSTVLLREAGSASGEENASQQK